MPMIDPAALKPLSAAILSDVMDSLGLTGQVPDGLLFRVSSVDPDAKRAYAVHEAFIADLLKAAKPQDRVKLAGV